MQEPRNSFGGRTVVILAAVGMLLLEGCAPTTETAGVGSEGGQLSAIAAPSITGALGGISVAAPPIAAYTRFARSIRTCWLAGQQPLVKNVKFFAKATYAEGEQASINLLQMTADGKHGDPAYTLQLFKSGSGAAAYVENHSLDDALAQRLRRDLERWAAGDVACQTNSAQAWAADPSAATPKPVAGKK